MLSIPIILLLCVLPIALLQTVNPQLCEETVTVDYFVTERTPIEAYGKFAEHFRKLNIPGEMRKVRKTKLELRKVCCAGFEKQNENDLICQPIQTPESTTETTVETSPLDLRDHSALGQQGLQAWPICVATLVIVALIVVSALSVYYIRRRRLYAVGHHEHANELEARTHLYPDSMND